MADEKLTTEQIKNLWPLLYKYWHTNRSLRNRQFFANLLRPRKDKEERMKHNIRILALSKEIEELDKKFEMILHPDEET